AYRLLGGGGLAEIVEGLDDVGSFPIDLFYPSWGRQTEGQLSGLERQRQEMLGMEPAGCIELIVCCQLIESEFADSFEELETGRGISRCDAVDHAAIEKGGHHFQRG